MAIVVFLLFLNCLGYGDNTCEQKVSTKKAYEILKDNLKSIQETCGDVCNTAQETERSSGGLYVKALKKSFDCQILETVLMSILIVFRADV